MKLELKHLAPYLPYKLKIASPENKKGLRSSMILTGIHLNDQGLFDHLYKPILRPLSYLTQEIEHNGERFVPIEYLVGKYGGQTNVGEWAYLYKRDVQSIEDAPYKVIQMLLEWHFDIFGLIHAGLAVDINTIKQQ